MMPMMRHHGDDVDMTSQPIAVKIEIFHFYRIDTPSICSLRDFHVAIKQY